MARKKKVVEENIVIDPNFACDEYQISLTPPAGFPDSKEAIVRTKYVPGSFLYLPEVYEGSYSFLNETDTSKNAKLCIALILEIDKGNKGAFNDEYYADADKKTEGLQQFNSFKKNFLKVWGGKDAPTDEILKTAFGTHMRNYHRAILFRFLGYFVMGYQVAFTKIEKQTLTAPTEVVAAV